MSTFIIGKYIVRFLMSAGSCILLLMLADILYRLVIYICEFISARIHRRNQIDSLKSMILSSGFGKGDFDGLNGVMLPIVIGTFASGFIFYTFGLKDSSLAILIILLWTVTWACFSNCRYHKMFYLHSVLLVKRFFACFVTSQTTQDAMVNAYASIPPGTIKTGMKECIKQKERNVSWEKAIRVFNNGTFCGQVLTSYLNIFENSNAIVTDEITASFTDELTERAESIIEKQSKTRQTSIVLLIASLAYTAMAAWFIYTRNLSGFHVIVLYFSGIALATSRLLLRNSVVNGRLI